MSGDRTADPLLVCVGRLSEQKGQDLAIHAVALLPGVRLRLVGDGPERIALQQLTQRLGVADRVELTGSVDPRPHLRAADVVVLPSRWEGMSLLLLEAMACGAPIVATATGGHSALAGCAVVLPLPLDPRRLADALSSLLADAGGRASMGRRARAVAVGGFEQTAVHQRYVDLWQHLSRKTVGETP